MEHHFVCAECRAVSKLAGTCQNDDCVQQGIRTKECHCEDGKHEMVLGTSSGGDDASLYDTDPTDSQRSTAPTNMIDLDSESYLES